ncbi:MAG: hypothetical protein P4L56_17335, partial [Candidatus Sulfopaludibacter sp.]|nr:hypothetical protein [Candidatus Sulfopaludibacter sp.]
LAAFPALFWDGAADTAPALRDAGIQQIVVPTARLDAWKGVAGINAEAGNLQGAVKVLAPTVNYRMNEAAATRAPWVVANGWRFIRRPGGRFYYDAPGKQAALAAAEAFCYGANALIQTDAAGLKPLAEMLAFLHALPAEDLPPVADIGYIDDQTATSGEVMNLLVRDNLLFQVVPAPDPRFKINVKLGAKEYPLQDAKNPGTVAKVVRANLTDEKRSVRVYGSQVVVARLTASGGRLRLHLLNYAGADRKVEGIRVRLLGSYPNHQLALAGGARVELLDYSAESDATEFTLPELSTYAVIDLSR